MCVCEVFFSLLLRWVFFFFLVSLVGEVFFFKKLSFRHWISGSGWFFFFAASAVIFPSHPLFFLLRLGGTRKLIDYAESISAMKSTKSYLQWILDKSAKSNWDAKCFNTTTKSHLGNMDYGHKLTENYSHLNYQTDQLPAIVMEWMWRFSLLSSAIDWSRAW